MEEDKKFRWIEVIEGNGEIDCRSSRYVVSGFDLTGNMTKEWGWFEMSTMKSIYDVANNNEEIGVWKIPPMVFYDDSGRIRKGRGYGGIENGSKIRGDRHSNGGTSSKGKRGKGAYCSVYLCFFAIFSILRLNCRRLLRCRNVLIFHHRMGPRLRNFLDILYRNVRVRLFCNPYIDRSCSTI